MKKLLFAALVMAGCASSTSEPFEPTSKILLEVEYENYAWGHEHFGYTINGLGEIYAYPQGNLVKSVPTSDFGSIASKIANSAGGKLSEVKSQCADAGALTYWGYLYAGNGSYQRVMLRTEGDHAQQNTSQAAQDVIAYIRSLKLIQEFQGCDP
ncbi:MAG TPA: hypothetical protein VM100_08660 [Longimicrobiales bacterium]|nr:hypothetical protein [Longimicrobiales bacterium]